MPKSLVEPLIVSVSGLRGVVGASLTPEVAVGYAASFAQTLPSGPMVIGRDGRESGPMFLAAIVAYLRSSGREVIDCDVASTPTIGIVVRSEHAAGGIQISASHNPAQYNGMKLFSPAGRVLSAAAGKIVLERFGEFQAGGRTLPSSLPASAPQAGVRRVDGSLLHRDLVAAIVDVAAIRRRRPRVWLDSGHGAGACVGRLLLEYLGCEIVIEGAEPDGRYEHPPEPTAENLAAMLPRIALSGADIGFFQDPDADRLAIATAEGRFIGEEATLALAVDAILSQVPGPIVVNCSTSSMTSLITAKYGVDCSVSAVGEANVVDQMLTSGAVLGGEGNGGVIDPRVGLVRDSFVGMALVLDRMCANDQLTTIDSLARGLPRLWMKKTKVDLSPETQGHLLALGLQRIAAAFPEAQASTLDGLRLDWPGGWLLVRSSNTEPIVRIIAEAADPTTVDEALSRATAALRSRDTKTTSTDGTSR